MTKLPSGSVIEYEKMSYRKEIKDSTGVLVFPVKAQAAQLEYLLKTSFDSTLTLSNTQLVYYQDALKTANNRIDSLKIAGLFYSFGNRGYSIPLVCDSLYKSSIPQKRVSKSVLVHSPASTATCQNYINLSLDMTFQSTSCNAGNMEQLGWQVVDYLCQQLQQQVSAELNEGIFVQNVPGLGIRIAGPVSVVKFLTGYELDSRLETIASAIPLNSYSLFGCYLVDVHTTFPDVVGGNCGDGGIDTPPTEACVQQAQAQLAAEFDSYCESSSSEQNYENYYVADAPDPVIDDYKWIIAEGGGWKLAARTEIKVEYTLPVNPDKYLRNKKLTLTHLRSYFSENSSILFTSTWTESNHTETYQYNNTPHPRGDARVYGEVYHKLNGEVDIDRDTPCGRIKIKLKLDKLKEADNTLHVLL